MALVTQKAAEIDNGGAYVEFTYEDTNELVSRVAWANNLAVNVIVTVRNANGATVLDSTLSPGASGAINLSGGDRFKRDAYSMNLAN